MAKKELMSVKKSREIFQKIKREIHKKKINFYTFHYSLKKYSKENASSIHQNLLLKVSQEFQNQNYFYSIHLSSDSKSLFIQLQSI